MILPLALAASLVSTPAPLRLAGEILHVRDVATVATGRGLPILRLPAGVRAVTLDRGTVRALVSARLPGVRFALHGPAPLRVVRGAGDARPSAQCVRARADIAGGTPIDAEMVERGRCDGAVPRLGYDRVRRTPIARLHVPAGANLGPVRVAAVAPLAVGRTLTLRTEAGAVTIERQVTSLQPGRPGRRMFVQTQDGAVLASRLAATAR